MKDLKGFLLRIVYLALAGAMFYFNEGGIMIGGFGVMYQYLFALALIAFAFTLFLVKPETSRMLVVLRCSGVLSAHYAWIWLYSLLIWGLTLSAANIMIRGSFFVIYQLIGIFAAAATVYLFGREGVRMQIYALLLANAVCILQAFSEHGIGPFFREYVELICSFTARTGPIMKSFESRNFAYMFGFFLLYQILELLCAGRLGREGLRERAGLLRRWWVFPLCAACFLLGLKRSVLVSMTVGFAFGLLLLRQSPKDAYKLTRLFSWGFVLFGLGYVLACYFGFMTWLESIGIDTSSRAVFFEQFKVYYEVGLGYFGKGAGYVSRMMADGKFMVESNGYVPLDIHNDFLRQYIELGFFGFLIWMYTFLNFKSKYFFHHLQNETDKLHGVLAFCFILSNYITFMTENTLYYSKLTMMASLIIMSYHFEDYCEAEEAKWKNCGSGSFSTGLTAAGPKK